MKIRVGKVAVISEGENPGAAISKIMLDRKARPIFQRMLEWLVGRMRFAFNVGGHHTHGGDRWQALSPATQEYKADHGWSPLILVRTTQLKLSTEGRLAPQADGSMRIDLFNKTPWYKYHQQEKRRSNWLPQRKVIEVTNRDRDFIRRQIVSGLMAYING